MAVRRPARRRRRRAAIAVLLATLALPGAIAAVQGGGGSPAAEERAAPVVPGVLRIEGAGRRLARVELSGYTVAGELARRRLAAALDARVPSRFSVRRAGVRIDYVVDRRRMIARAVAAGVTGGVVRVPVTASSSSIAAPVVAQELRNNCEAAALEVLLATTGRRVDQLTLLAELPRSGTPDPIGSGPERVWGDPELGFVGRPDGGGVAGGFGVFQRPVMEVAARRGRPLDDLTGVPPAAIYERLLSGRAVMVWVGLSDGPYGEWRSPEGRPVRVNFGEHTVVLTGVRPDGALDVVNVLQGTSEVWSRDKFIAMWSLLGRRAVSPRAAGAS